MQLGRCTTRRSQGVIRAVVLSTLPPPVDVGSGPANNSGEAIWVHRAALHIWAAAKGRDWLQQGQERAGRPGRLHQEGRCDHNAAARRAGGRLCAHLFRRPVEPEALHGHTLQRALLPWPSAERGVISHNPLLQARGGSAGWHGSTRPATQQGSTNLQ